MWLKSHLIVEVSVSHTYSDALHTLGSSPLNERFDSWLRALLAQHTTNTTEKYPYSQGFRTRDPSNRAAATKVLDRMATGIGQTPSNILYYLHTYSMVQSPS